MDLPTILVINGTMHQILIMAEIDEFAEALIDQIKVELEEEREIDSLASRIAEDPDFKESFEPVEDAAKRLFDDLKTRVSEFTCLEIPTGLSIEFPELADLKILKGKKVFTTRDSRGFVDRLFHAISKEDKAGISELVGLDTAKFLTYSTYAKSYISKITTTYGDCLDQTIYLNRFILSRYPQIILYKQGAPYAANFDRINSGYMGALKMTLLEELVHSMQSGLAQQNKDAVVQINRLNEELASVILHMNDGDAAALTDHLQLQAVPDDFPIARRANLFFMLNPDNFIMNSMGPQVLTFTHVEIDPKISQYLPELAGIYQQWLGPIQKHESIFSVMEGMAEFCMHNILLDDNDFGQYLSTFMGSDISVYRMRKSMGRDFVSAVFKEKGKEAFVQLLDCPPTTRQLQDPKLYLES